MASSVSRTVNVDIGEQQNADDQPPIRSEMPRLAISASPASGDR